MAGFYCVLILLFTTVNREAEARYQAKLAELSVSALQSRIDTIQAIVKAIRIERHDLRHRFQILAELLNQGKLQDARAFIGAAEKQLEEKTAVHWCRPPILDAVFSFYFGQAWPRIRQQLYRSIL